MIPNRVFIKTKKGNYSPAILYDIKDGLAWCFETGENGGGFGWTHVKLNKVVPAEFIHRAHVDCVQTDSNKNPIDTIV